MAKSVHNDVLDAALDKIATANIMTLCSQQPTTRTEAITTYMLADVTMTVGDGNGDYTIADGDTSGRKVTVTAQAGESVTNSGTGDHVALCDGSSLLYVTTCTGVAVTAGGTVDFPAWDGEILDPA
jgi:hypothetical protein